MAAVPIGLAPENLTSRSGYYRRTVVPPYRRWSYRPTALPPTFSPVTQSFGPDVLVVRFSAIGDILLT
ncbi:MAG TPA: hypothetical protein VH764_00015, partial [Gemmatimonadales bacterium]